MELPTNFSYDWAPYRAVFGDTPMQDAVTSMFSEYAVLYARIAGWVTACKPAPMTVQEAQEIAKHAEGFVLNYMTPILGPLHTSKVHKLLRHVLDSILMHGHLKNGNTSSNESEHKIDKKFYRRTNKSIATFTAQIVRQSQGTRELLSHLDAEDVLARRTLPTVRASGSGDADASSVPASNGASPSAVQAPPPAGVPRPRRIRSRLTVRDLARRPGLKNLGQALGRQPTYKVGVLTSKRFDAELDCGTRMQQIVRATSSFRGIRGTTRSRTPLTPTGASRSAPQARTTWRWSTSGRSGPSCRARRRTLPSFATWRLRRRRRPALCLPGSAPESGGRSPKMGTSRLSLYPSGVWLAWSTLCQTLRSCPCVAAILMRPLAAEDPYMNFVP